MGSIIISGLWILLVILVLVGVFLAALWLLRYVGLPIPPQVERFGLAIIALLALIWVVSLVLGGGPPFAWPLLR
jgi:hypothetical protein